MNKVYLILLTSFIILITGCSFGTLPLDHAKDLAIEFAEEYIHENELSITIEDVKIFDVARSDDFNKWDVYLEVERESSEFDLSALGWVSVSDEEEIIEYNLWSD
ncbi:hypothetical protein N0O92_12915 [Alkalihalobacillus sp. MEB130]|uniref:hypothetical protein n=1 Tax=Alkalihalobacillus sp. MEB130 TaxID=2976704 RepID=UPI0028E04E75|nr:hypothetical protein [Alkalihalobacillus sp. MEB130]MDT8861137.1 hypothetical protein [Alkalihalobacillus sp. MEB130]